MASNGARNSSAHGAKHEVPILREQVGSLVDTRRLAALLAYPSANAVRHAHRRGRLPVPLFRVLGRRGLFARMNDVKTLLQQGLQQAHPPAPNGASTTTEEVS